MTSDIGILAFGVYLPKSRLQRSAIHAANAWFAPSLKTLAKGERAVANWDEDSVTMAVEAARDALIGIERSNVTSLSLASTTLPFADRLNAGIVKEALNLTDQVGAADHGGGQRAGTTALLQTLYATATTGGQHLCLAAERRLARPASEAELMQGDGAAAFLVGKGRPIARLLAAHSVTIDFVDHFRSAGESFDYAWESRWIRDEGFTGLLGGAIRDGLAAFGVGGHQIDKFIVPITARGVPEGLAKLVGIRAEAVVDSLATTVGDTGVAHPLLLLAAALESAGPGQKILVAGFGQGADLLLFETTAALDPVPGRVGLPGALARRRADQNYPRFLFHRGLLALDRGMRAELDHKQPGSTLYRNRKTVLGLVGGRCTRSGTVQFPKSEVSVDPMDPAVGTQEDYPFADRHARIVSFTADRLTYSPDPPLYYGIIDFDGGGRMVTEFTDVDPVEITVGRKMRMVFRIKAIDETRHFIKYFWKAVPVD